MLNRRSNEDVAQLHYDSLVILITVTTSMWLLLLIMQLLYTEITGSELSPLPLIVLLVAVVIANWLKSKNFINQSGLALISGLLASPTLFLALEGPSHMIYFWFVIPVVAASMIISGKAGYWSSTIASFLMFGATLIWHSPSNLFQLLQDSLSLTWTPVLTCFLVAGISHLNDHNILTMVQWAINSQHRDAQRNEMLNQKQSELEKALNELQRANGKLQLLNAELVEAERSSDLANRHKTEFLANVSHELRSPLNLILSYCQATLAMPNLYTNNQLPPNLLRNLQHIEQSSQYLDQLINDLLDISRAEMNVLQIFPEPLDARSFLEEIFYNLADNYSRQHEVEWKLKLPTTLPIIQADPVRLRQIMFNLLTNAVKFTQKGHIELGAEVALPHLHIWVEDSGCGIPTELQERIFDPFISSYSPKQAGTAGIGLGLTITRHLLNLHASTLTLQSQLEQGTTFHLYLPLPGLDGKLAASLPKPVTALPSVLLLLSSGRQPAPEILEIAERQDLAVYSIDTTATLQEVLEEVNPVGLVWNLGQGELENWGIIQQLRTNPTLCRLPIILYSQQTQTNNTSIPPSPQMLVGVTDFVLKPLNNTVLIKTAHALTSSNSTSRSILIAEDDPKTQELYQQLLSQAFPNYRILIADDGTKVFERLEQEIPELIILDLVMPGMDGFSVLEKLRANPSTRKIPVMVLSGQVLSYKDVERLNHAQVVFQNKQILSHQELHDRLHQLIERTDELNPNTSILVKKAVAYIHQNYNRPISRQDIAGFIQLNERYFSQIFRQETGLSPWDYLNRYRINQAKKLLVEYPRENIMAIAAQVGFNDAAYFSRVFSKEVGVSPTSFRESLTGQ